MARVVTTDEIVLAPSWRHQIEDGHARTELLLHYGSEICSDRIGVVFNRLRDVGMPNFTASKREDRDYATMEMFALLLSWLSALPCPVVNSPSPQGLAGATRHPALWLAMAEYGLRRARGVLPTPLYPVSRPAIGQPGSTSPSSGFIAAHWSPAAKFTDAQARNS